MGKRLTIHGHNNKIELYDIVIEHSFDRLADELEKFNLSKQKLCTGTDRNDTVSNTQPRAHETGRKSEGRK
ncbi:hypothetical protein CG709_06720 [Lachnotalea glycerini]|nr:hypothetical protein CG709_06720 [Lachnotalea glycerini]